MPGVPPEAKQLVATAFNVTRTKSRSSVGRDARACVGARNNAERRRGVFGGASSALIQAAARTEICGLVQLVSSCFPDEGMPPAGAGLLPEDIYPAFAGPR